MKTTKWNRLAIARVACCASATAQSTAPVVPKAKTVIARSSTMRMLPAYLGGADDCNSVHPLLGPGDVPSEPFTTGTTGTTGQNEANCLFFGTTGITNDVWYDWTANMTMYATLRTCNSSTDTKVAIYPLSTCPADDTSIACNDDACVLKSIVSWPVTSGTSYTIQLGTFPGASGGSGSFSITQSRLMCGGEPCPPECGMGFCVYQVDDGGAESSAGFGPGGDTAWLMMLHTNWFGAAIDEVTHVGTAYGSPNFPGQTPPNGTPVRVFVWDELDDDGDPRTGDLLLVSETMTQIANADTQIVNYVQLPEPATVHDVYFVGFAVTHSANQYTASADTSGPGMLTCQFAWFHGTPAPGGFDPNDFQSAPVDAVWLCRATTTESEASLYCSGDGTGTACPCGNNSTGLVYGGCANSTDMGGSLAPSQSASVGQNDLLLTGSNLVPGQSALIFTGDQALNGGAGIPFGDGLRCVGGNVVRLGVKVVSAIGKAEWAGLPHAAGWAPGDIRRLQVWYRDPAGSPCSTGFNQTNAVEVRLRP